MRKFLFIALIAAVTQLASAQFNADTNARVVDYGSYRLIQTKLLFASDSTGTFTSNPFQLSGWDQQSFYSYPSHFSYLTQSAADSPYVSIYIDGTLGPGLGWYRIDTLARNDSSETLIKGTANLNDNRAALYRYVIKGETGNRADVIVQLRQLFYRKN